MKLAFAFLALQTIFLTPCLYVFPIIAKSSPLIAILLFQSALNSALFAFCIVFAHRSMLAAVTEKIESSMPNNAPIIIFQNKPSPVPAPPKSDRFEDLDDFHSSKSTEEEVWT